MKRIAILAVVLLAATKLAVAQAAPPTLASVMDAQIKLVETQFVALAEAMPADKYDFAPGGPNFDGVRTFALEVRHVAAANFVFYSAMLDQEPPPGVSTVGATNGPEELKTKEQIVKFLKASYALGHKAVATLTESNATLPLKNPPIMSMNSRLALASFSVSHDYDHYGQMVVYLRMNGITPPPSQGQPPANPKKAD